jgi:hypothetical protein
MGLVMNRFHWLTIVGLAVHSLAGGAQSVATEKQTQAVRPVSGIAYRSAFEGYRADADVAAGNWRTVNAAVLEASKDTGSVDSVSQGATSVHTAPYPPAANRSHGRKP